MRNIFLDLDGTLIDVSEKYYRVYADFMKQERREQFLSKERFMRLKRQGKRNSALFKDKRMLMRYEAFFLKNIEREHYLRHDRMFRFSLRVLEKLRKPGVRLFAVTLRRNKKNLLWEMKRFGFPAAVSVLRGASRPFHRRSDYETKKRLVRKFTHAGDIMIGDTEADILCGKSLGIATIGVCSGMRGRSFLKKLKPEFVVRDIRSVPLLLS